MSERTYWVYIMTNQSGTLYTGVTGNLSRRVHEHRHRLVPGFATRYKIDQLKAWRRSHKVALIDSVNPEWNDLGEVWFGLKDAMNLGSPTPCDSSENDEIPPSSG